MITSHKAVIMEYETQLLAAGIFLLGLLLGVAIAALHNCYMYRSSARVRQQHAHLHDPSGRAEAQPLLRAPSQPLQIPSQQSVATLQSTYSASSSASTLVQNLDPLKLQVRLMRLHAGPPGDKLSCSLQIESLEPTVKGPVYEALSYVWAEMTGEEPLEVDGVQMPITVNLAEALRQLRLPDRDRVLWVDAVCINQAHEKERSHQVRLMGTVYARASRVLIWLGPESQDSAQALRDLQSLSQDRHFRDTDIFGRTVIHPDGRESWVPTPAERIKPIESLLSRAYWSRVWVVQEIVRAQRATVLCGSSSVEWEVCVNVRDNWSKHSRKCCNSTCNIIDPRTRRTMNWLNSSWKRYQDTDGDLLSRLNLTRGLKATDPRDKIYGALGLVSDSMCFLDPDYTSEYNVVFRDWASKMIQVTGRLEALFYIQHFAAEVASQDAKLPSWVPDWSKYEATVRFQAERLEHHRHISHSFNADGGASMQHSFLRLGDWLRLAGHVVGTVARVGNALRYDRDPNISDDQNQIAAIKTWNAVLETWLSVALEFGSADAMYPGGGIYESAYWRTLLSDHITEVGTYLGDRVSETTDGPRYEAWRNWFTTLVGQPDESKPSFYKDSLAENRDLDRFDWTIINMNYNRRLFSTKDGRIGVGPAHMQPDDTIIVLSGGSTPFVVRPSSEETGAKTFRVVGYAYLHGVMDGEFMSDSRPWHYYWFS